MRRLLRFEHWVIRQFKFDRMTNNLVWLTVMFAPFIAALLRWLFLLHEHPAAEFMVFRDSAFAGKVAEIAYQDGAFAIRPLVKNVLLNFKPLLGSTPIQEDDQLVIGHLILQVQQLDDWTPHLRTIGYYLTDKELNAGVTVGRSMHSEALNNWKINDLIVKDTAFEPVHFTIALASPQQYRLRNVSRQGVDIPYIPPKEKLAKGKKAEEPPEWTHLTEEAVLQAGQRIKIGDRILELAYIPAQEALALRIIEGVRPTYKLSREAVNIVGGLSMMPQAYIPDYLVDEEFLEYVRQAIEQGLFAVTAQPPRLQIKGFDAAGRLAPQAFAQLTPQEKFLLHKVFNFKEQAGAGLLWRRPFSRDAEDSHTFYPEQIENFSLEAETNQIKDISDYAARLTNPHTIAAEVATERGEIYDRNRFSYARLWAYADPQQQPRAELLLVPATAANTMLPVNTSEPFDNIIYVGGGYEFSGGTAVIYAQDEFQQIAGGQQRILQDGDTFTDGQYTFQYSAPGKGGLALNLKTGQTARRYYPLGSRLAHTIGYSYARSQFKGHLEEIFDQVLLGTEKKQPWWSLQRTLERSPGNNLILTIDDDLQRVVYAELNKKLTALNEHYKTAQFRGAAVMLNAEGEILASATLPSYNPNDLRSILGALADSVQDHWNSAYINRATHKSYPPGSTMKVLMATLALDNKAKFLREAGDGQYLIKNDGGNFVCTGHLAEFHGVSFGRYDIPDFSGEVHGELTLDRALTESCNNTFAFLALNAGWETIQAYAERYGFNRPFDLLPYRIFKKDASFAAHIKRDVGDALAGLRSQVPTPPADFKLPQLARMGIGQWEIQATPLQMATVAMTVGNAGLRPYPHLVKAIENRADGKIRKLIYPPKEQAFPAQLFTELTPMMQHVVQAGTARRIAASTIPYYALKDHVAGKTGTAEVENPNGSKSNVIWFLSFAPVEKPQLALVIVIERGPVISGEAVEVARGIWEKAVLLYPEMFETTEAGGQK